MSNNPSTHYEDSHAINQLCGDLQKIVRSLDQTSSRAYSVYLRSAKPHKESAYRLVTLIDQAAEKADSLLDEFSECLSEANDATRAANGD